MNIMNKHNRKNAIARILSSVPVHTQDELITELGKMGCKTTQATLSRDMRELGAVKALDPAEGFIYVLPASYAAKGNQARGSGRIRIKRLEVSGQLCVIQTLPGFASAAASLIDTARIDSVMGTIAGDDTLLLILRAGVNPDKVVSAIEDLLS